MSLDWSLGHILFIRLAYITGYPGMSTPVHESNYLLLSKIIKNDKNI